MGSLNIALVVPRTEAEGPGWRFAVWVQGCPFRCEGCCNPGMLPFRPADGSSPEALLASFLAADVEGLSLLGGEPFAQAEGLAVLARGARAAGRSVMVFTGYTLDELRALGDAPGVAALLDATDILVDGRYDASRRTLTRRWVGSDNQVMHFLSDRYHPEDPVFSAPNHIEIRVRNGQLTLNGWPLHGSRTRLV